MNKIKKVETKAAPAAIGPYSQAIIAGDFVFVAGQIPIDPDTGLLLEGSIEKQTELVIRNIKNILGASGLGLENVVKVEVFLKDISNFAKFNEVYGLNFASEVKPARAVVEVSRLPKDAGVEISCIAFKG